VWPLKVTVQVSQQFFCELPLRIPVKQFPPTPTPFSAVPVFPVYMKVIDPLGGFGGTCQLSLSSPPDTSVTVIVALSVLEPLSLFGVEFCHVPL
jgi:hypothetical protein